MAAAAAAAADSRTGPVGGDKNARHTTLFLGALPPKQKGFGSIAGNGPRTPSRVNPDNPPWEAFRGYHEYSFAHEVMGERLPTILSKAIDDVVLTLNQENDEDFIIDLVECIHRMEDLKVDLRSNAKLRPIIDDNEADVALWNKELARYFRGKDFMNSPWLFAEAYKYRRLRECFSLSKHWKDYDVFFRQKCDTFGRSGQAVFELSERFANAWQLPETAKTSEQEKELKKLVFLELTQICLWGNSTDLSLLIGMTEEDIKRLQSTGGEHLKSTEKNILGNDLEDLWQLVSSFKGARLDFILDNAGFELYCDMIYADWLVQTGMAAEIRFHGKRLPWFVSDVTKKDFDWLINIMVYGQLFPSATDDELHSLRKLGLRWKQYVHDGIWVYEAHPFWCTAYTYWELAREAPDLFLHLANSNLCIYKGDLNHRKLTYDCHAPPSTPFEIAIGPLGSLPGAAPVCSLRTIKSDVIVALPAGVAERLDAEEEKWRISGKYAVVLLAHGHQDEAPSLPMD